MSYGKTDDCSYNIVKDPVSVHDLHATFQHLLGIDHTALTFKFQARDFTASPTFMGKSSKIFWPGQPKPNSIETRSNSDNHVAHYRANTSGIDHCLHDDVDCGIEIGSQYQRDQTLLRFGIMPE
ncbi:MAG: hypothetical protein M2R45_02376 [Verrucomicrobia subdivision 3 bacterium]|nr:hypothetical protein [Limisphaerales bacterium]MCS1414927.1 hypothetical protein [Limisphaerales bacterium]